MSDLNRPVLDRILKAIEVLHPYPPLWVALQREEFLDVLTGKLNCLLLQIGPEDVRSALSDGRHLEECPECPITDDQCREALGLAHKYYTSEHGIDTHVLKHCAETIMCQS